MELTILMPCLNEAETVKTCVEKAEGYLRANGIDGEVLIADNGSTDGSQALAAAAGARVIHVPQRGYGAALLHEIRAARGKYVIMGDADDSYDFTALGPFVDKLRSGYDLVMGNRFRGGIAPNAMPALHRYLGNPVLSGLGRLFFKSPVGDFHCGLRAFRREPVLRLNLSSPGMEFASEMVVKATLNGLRIAEVPTTLSPDGRSRPPHLRSWRDGWRHLRFLLFFSPTWLFFYPGLALLLASAAAAIWLLPGERSVGDVTFDLNTLIFATGGIVCGFQAVVFYMLAKAYAMRSGLLPRDRVVERLRTMFRFETGLIVGGSMFAVGLGLAAYAVGAWGSRSFGPLPLSSLRIVVPSVMLLMVGLQIAFASALLGILHLEQDNAEADAPVVSLSDARPPTL